MTYKATSKNKVHPDQDNNSHSYALYTLIRYFLYKSKLEKCFFI